MIGAAAWLVGGLLLAGLEMLAPGVFLLPIGLAAVATGLLTLLGPSEPVQVAVFAGLAVCLVGGAAWRMRRHPVRDSVNAPAAALVGRLCRAVSFADGEGRVALGDGQWNARLPPGARTIVPGQALRVVGLDGTVLLVDVDD